VVRSAPLRGRVDEGSSLEVLVEVGVARMTIRGGLTPEHLAATTTATAAAAAC